MRIRITIPALLLVAAVACKHDIPDPIDPPANQNPVDTTNNDTTGSNPVIPDPCDPDSVYFENDVLPLLISSCTMSGCHNENDHADGVILTNYSDIMITGKIDIQDPWDSDIMDVITETDPDKIMPPPPAAALSSDEIQTILTWIQQGALNNGCDGPCDTTMISFSQQILPMFDTYCVNCHKSGFASGGIDLSSYNDVVAVNSNRLLGSITHNPAYSNMPKNAPKLSECQIGLLRNWINEGSKNN